MKRIKHAFLSALLLIFVGCSTQSHAQYRKRGEALVKDISEDLQKIKTKDDLSSYVSPLKKKMKKLCALMIEAADYAEKAPKVPIEDSSSLYSDQLQYELLRVCEIEGVREAIENLQADMLDKIDAYYRKAQRKKLSKSRHFKKIRV